MLRGGSISALYIELKQKTEQKEALDNHVTKGNVESPLGRPDMPHHDAVSGLGG